MAKAANVKLQNKQANQQKRSSFRVEKDARRAKRAEENASTITHYVAGEATQVSTKSKQGKKILAKQKKRKAEAKADRLYESRNARVSQDQVRDVLTGKKTGTTINQLRNQLEQEKQAIKEARLTGVNPKSKSSAMDNDSDDEDSGSAGGQSNNAKPLTVAQREIQEMLERSKRAQALEEKIKALQNGEDISDESDVSDVEEPVSGKFKMKRPTAKEVKAARSAQRLANSKDYDDEEEINMGADGGDHSDIDVDSEDLDEEYGYDEDIRGGNQMDSDEPNSDDSDYEVRQQYKEKHSTFIKNTRGMGEKKHVREAMLATLYDDLPKYRPMPAKMAGLLKSQGKNVKEIEAQRKSDHELKIAKILADRERKIREYDSDDDDSDMEEGEDEADYFLRKMADQQDRRKARREEKEQQVDSDEEDEDAEEEKALTLGQVKQLNKAERAAQKKALHDLWVKQRDERVATAIQRDGEDRSKKDKNDKVSSRTPSPTTTTTTPTPQSLPKPVPTLATDANTLRKKAEMKQIQAQKEQTEEMATQRLMVLLDDGTWGYRDVDLAPQTPAAKPDLSAYVRLPKKSKKQIKAEERAAAEALEEDPNEDGKDSDALDKFAQFLKQDAAKGGSMDDKDGGHDEGMEMDEDEDEDEEHFDEDDESDLEFEGDEDGEWSPSEQNDQNGQKSAKNAKNLETDLFSIKPSKTSKSPKSTSVSSMYDSDDGDEDSLSSLSAKEKATMKKQLQELNSYHESRLDRIRQVQLILAQLCTELLENPHKYIVGGHLEALLKLCGDKDSTVQQLAIASTATVFSDILPSYRIKYHQSLTHTGVNNSTRLTKDVRIMRTYENTLLDHYKNFLTLLNKYVHRGLSLFYAKQRVLWNQMYAQQQQQEKGGEVDKKDTNQANPYEDYAKVNISLAEKQSTLYTIALQSSCQVFQTAYGFNFNTQLAALLAHVLTSDHLEWCDLVTKTVSEVFKKDKCSESTHEIVTCIADVCKKRAGEKIRAPLLSVLLEIPFSYQVIHYKDPNAAKKEMQAKKDAKAAKNANKVKGVTGAGHHYATKLKEQQEKTMKQMKKALRSGKEYQGPDPNETFGKSVHDLQLEVQKELKESEAVVTIAERQKLQTKCLSLVFTVFFRYLKQAPTIKTLYNYNTVNAEHQQEYELLKQSFTAQSTVHKTAELLSIPKEHRNQVILTQTMLGIVTPPTHFVLAIVLKGIMKFGSLINVELVLDLLAHLLLVIQTATALESLPLSSSLLSLECIFTLLQMHGSAIDIDLAPHYQVLYTIIWQLLSNPEYTFLAIKCVDLSIIQRKHLQYRRVAAIVRRLFQVALHLPPQYSLPLLQISSQCCTAHPTIGTIFDNDKMQSGLYDLGHPQPDTSDAIGTPAWESLAPSQTPHPYSSTITTHTLLSDLRLGTNTNVDGKTVGNQVDRQSLSISLTTLELPSETNGLERPQRITRQIAVSRLKPLELYTAIDVSKGGFCPDVEAPDAKKLRKLMHYEWYDRHNWLAQVEELKENGAFNHFNLSYQSKLMGDILGGQDTVASFLEKPIGGRGEMGMGDEEEF